MTRFDPAGPLRGELRPPPDKSVTHRAALIGAMADGPTRITGYLDSEDTRSTLRAVAAVGAEVREGEPDDRGGLFVEIEGVGLRGARSARVDVGNAGTLLRIMPGWLAGQPEGEWTFDGDDSIRRRPVDRIADPLRLMGAEVECRDGRLPPLTVRGSRLQGIDYEMPVASAQVKSCLLLAGLLAESETAIHEPICDARPHRAHARRDGRLAAPRRRRAGHLAGRAPGGGRRPGARRLLLGGLLHRGGAPGVPDSEVALREVGINRNRIGLLSILARMGVEMGGGAPGSRERRRPDP